MLLDAIRPAGHAFAMDKPPPRPTLTDRALADKQARDARAAAALRANLLRRKQQARERAQPADAGTPPAQPSGAPEEREG